MDGLIDEGWLLPRGLRSAEVARWTLVGTVASPTATAVDPAGLVVGEGWSLDWWIGADDRWHLPSREAAVRQDLRADAPITETRLRIPGGDAVQRVYGFRAAASGDDGAGSGNLQWAGDEWVAVEIENQTPVPFAVALVIRPLMADAVGSIGHISVEPTGGGQGREVAHLVRVDGRPGVLLPRRPARMAVGNRADGDVVAAVTGGAAASDLADAVCPDGLATAAFVFPLPHTAILRVALPIGAGDGVDVGYPPVVPDAATVASGWDLHRRGPRFDVPDQRVNAAVARARTQVFLAHDGEIVRRDGRPGDAIDIRVEPGATDVILSALDVLDRPGEVDAVIARWPHRTVAPSPQSDAVTIEVVARHWLLHRSPLVLDTLLPDVAAAVERIDKAERRGRLTDPLDRRRVARALSSGGALLEASGQGDAGAAVLELSQRFAEAVADIATGHVVADRLMAVVDRSRVADRGVVDLIDGVLADLSPTAAAVGPSSNLGRGHRSIGHDLAAAGALVLAVRSLLIGEEADGLDLVPVLVPSWYGAGVEVHDAPTFCGRLSFALRWHGRRPALLWELEPHAGTGPVTLRSAGLDPSWSTAELRGEALLAEVGPPRGVELVSVVAEHPDIDPAMRRPGDATEPMATAPEIPEGGTFS